jgi:PAS domain S-box-containing protein
VKPFDDRELLSSIEMATFKHQAERRIRESEMKFREIAETAAAAIFMFQGNRLTYVNSFGEALTGYRSSELSAMNFWDFVHPAYRETVRERELARQSGAAVARRYEFKIVRNDGSERWLDFSAGVIVIDGKPAVLGTALDITSRKRAEEERYTLQGHLMQAQKMESLGTLVVGLAHNFNNILAIVLGYASRLERGLTDPAKLSQSITAIERAVQRGAGLIQQLGGVTRKANLELGHLQVNTVVEELVPMLTEIFPKSIAFRLLLDPKVPTISADHNQIHQALMNLCVNARDAMPEGGSLTIRSDLVPSGYLRNRIPNPLDCPYVRLMINDTGTGIDEKTQHHLFEPFFTTKDRALHTGLGLAMAYGIVSSHRGFIEVESVPGKGSSFVLFFPAESATAPAGETHREEEPDVRGGEETLLVVEPEEMLRALVRDVLTQAGYTVLEARDTDQAVEVLRTRGGQVDLLLIDTGLQEKPTARVIADLRNQFPEMKVVLSAGYQRKEKREEMLHAGAAGVIHKPYTVSEMLAVVRGALDESRPSG